MITKEVVINNQVGLHARPATFFIQKANEFKSSIWVEKEDRRVNAKSLLGVLSLGIVKGTAITIIADGADEEAAIATLSELIDSDFSEYSEIKRRRRVYLLHTPLFELYRRLPYLGDTMKKETKAMLEMLAAAALWSIAGIIMKFIPWNGFAVAGMRSLIAGLTFVVYMLIKRMKFIFTKQTFIAGIFAACVYTCFTCANKLTTAANAIVLQFTSPVFIVIFTALIYKTKIRKADLLVVIFTLFGIALFFFGQLQPGYILGNFVAIAAGMFMAGMFMAVGDLEGEMRFSAIMIGQFLTFLIGLPSIIITKPEFTLTATAGILVLGVFQLGIAYILYVKSTKYCPPLACSLLGAVEPLLNPVWVLIFYGEKPGVFALIGGVVVIVTITVWCIKGQEKAPEEAKA